MRNLLIIVLTVFVFVSCNDSDEKHDTTGGDTTATSDPKSKDSVVPRNDLLTIIGDSVEIPSFEIEISLSDKANAKLKKEKESIKVAAYFSGIPKDTTEPEYLKSGDYPLANAERELIDTRTVKFENVRFPKSLYESLASKNITLLINVFSGRRASNLNFLNVDILQDSMSAIKGKHFVLKGKLIGEQ